MPEVAWARVVRYAVVIGNNEGAADETSLRYAERDATRVHEVLRTLGWFHEENTVVLLGSNRETIQRVLISINARIRSASRGADQAVLLVYYSGHADADALHVRMADEAICIGPPSSAQSYLSFPAIISACEITGAQAIHPGYGFLSENAALARALEEAGE